MTKTTRMIVLLATLIVAAGCSSASGSKTSTSTVVSWDCLIYKDRVCPEDHPTPWTIPDSTTTSTTSTMKPAPAPIPEPVQVPVQVSGDCWTDLARSVGWPEDQLPRLQRTIFRESRCDPSAFADRPSTLDNSRGLLQINAYGSLAQSIRNLCGIEPDALFDPATNLTCGLRYFEAAGWSPWRGGA